MALSLEFAVVVVYASLLLVCVIMAKLCDMVESRAADRASTSSLESRKDSSEEPVTSASTNSQGLGCKRRAAKLDGSNTVSDFDGSVGQKLPSGDRIASEVEITASEEASGVCAGIRTELWRKEFDGIKRGSADDDDWEGVERSESARLFGRAVRFACSARNAGLILGIDGESTMKLYGLHRVALEGPCREHQPMAFRVSARAKWNAWQRLGNISPEVAMDGYINLLSEKIPNWMQNDAVEEEACTDAETFWRLICNLRTGMEQQTKSDRNRLQKLNPST